MRIRRLAVDGAIALTPEVFDDERGLFVSPYQAVAFVEATGGEPMKVAQTNHSESRRGVVRGIHFTATPPGTTKYVYCARGRALDMVVDLRRGSPTYRRWDAAVLDPHEFNSMYFPVGVGHAFVALEDDTVMCYLISDPYVPEFELAINVLDPELGLPIPDDITPILSTRDTAAPTLAEAERTDLLPVYADCR